MSSRRDLLKEFYKIPTASLSDALDAVRIKGFMNHGIRPIIEGVKMVGRAVTVKDVPSRKVAPPVLALEAIDRAQEGDVVVRAVEGDAVDVGLWGGLMALAAKEKGLAGAVIDGGTRDLAENRELKFPVFVRSVVPSTSIGRTQVVDINVPIVCGGVPVRPGDVIVGDDDGVVVIPQEKLKQVLKEAKQIDEREKKVAEALRLGKPLVETVRKYARI